MICRSGGITPHILNFGNRWVRLLASRPIRLVFREGASGRLSLKCDGTRAETRFYLSAKRTSPFKSVGASFQSTTGSRGVRISSSNAGYTEFWASEGNWLPTPFASFPFTSTPVRHRVPLHFNCTLPFTGLCMVIRKVLSGWFIVGLQNIGQQNNIYFLSHEL